jgi:hypothetical protein
MITLEEEVSMALFLEIVFLAARISCNFDKTELLIIYIT